MENLINIIKKYSSVIITSLITLLILCAFVCCLTQVIAKIGVFLASCGLIGTTLSLIISSWLLIQEIKLLR